MTDNLIEGRFWPVETLSPNHDKETVVASVETMVAALAAAEVHTEVSIGGGKFEVRIYADDWWWPTTGDYLLPVHVIQHEDTERDRKFTVIRHRGDNLAEVLAAAIETYLETYEGPGPILKGRAELAEVIR